MTSNRPDCLGHLGIAREVSVLFGQPLKVPDANPAASAAKTADATSVTVECPELCPQYFARVIRGVKVGPSPAWLLTATAGDRPALDQQCRRRDQLCPDGMRPAAARVRFRPAPRAQRIVVRRGRPGEKLIAINQKTYDLTPDMCVIADAERPVAIGGVMGGLETEIGPTARTC